MYIQKKNEDAFIKKSLVCSLVVQTSILFNQNQQLIYNQIYCIHVVIEGNKLQIHFSSRGFMFVGYQILTVYGHLMADKIHEHQSNSENLTKQLQQFTNFRFSHSTYNAIILSLSHLNDLYIKQQMSYFKRVYVLTMGHQ